MFKTLKRIIGWCGEFKGKLYAGFVFSFFSHLFAAMPVMKPSLLKSMAGDTTALAKPVMGTRAPAPPHLTILWYSPKPVSSTDSSTRSSEHQLPAVCLSSP